MKRVSLRRVDQKIIATILREAVLQAGTIESKRIRFDCDLYFGRSMTLEFLVDAVVDDSTDDPGDQLKAIFIWDGYMYVQGHKEHQYSLYSRQLSRIKQYIVNGVRFEYDEGIKITNYGIYHDNETDFQDAEGMGEL